MGGGGDISTVEGVEKLSIVVKNFLAGGSSSSYSNHDHSRRCSERTFCRSVFLSRRSDFSVNIVISGSRDDEKDFRIFCKSDFIPRERFSRVRIFLDEREMQSTNRIHHQSCLSSTSAAPIRLFKS